MLGTCLSARAALCSGATGGSCVLSHKLQPSQRSLLYLTHILGLDRSFQRSSEVPEHLV